MIENMRLAKAYIPRVGIETPMTPEFFAAFFQKKEAILATGIDSINCAELHLNENNLGQLRGRTPISSTARDTSLPCGATSSR